ncbi:hypothetical protein BACPLE_02831 [Phocaeicola plebeius DSM 17135]|uniref:Uncharacterized protein n=1 Tax=Phocaeicola plebeius (strain DSM 17135 / JCM 12973 / CCUG 54634 / M2) TaxID=484018 RepID=B5D1I7_PHOPM|nr:hypothetical protein BACPLE_02831 [Phocaeicola plebeius DSM 17135]
MGRNLCFHLKAEGEFSVLPKEYSSTFKEVLEYFRGSTSVLPKKY